MDLNARVKLAIYTHFAETGQRPSPVDVATLVSSDVGSVLDSYLRLREQRVLVLEADGSSIRMAPPFSGVPTQHVVIVGVKQYFANCAWDALGIPAAVRGSGVVYSRCEQSREPLRLAVGPDARTFRLALPLPGPSRKVVGRYRFHLKQHALLPVGRTGARVVRDAWISNATSRKD